VGGIQSMFAYRLKRCDDLVSALLHEVEISKVTLSSMGYDGSLYLPLHLLMRDSCARVASLVTGYNGG
jgi:hypothetical protein